MKPSRFDYVRPASLDETLEHLAIHGDEARILAGGQSLVPMMNLRLAAPALLVDINRVLGLDRLVEDEAGLRVGATVRHAELMAHVSRSDAYPLLASALPFVAHGGVRNRGTVCGSLALADPASELPACALCLEAEIGVVSQTGRRVVPARDFFRGLYETALAPGEMIEEVLFPSATQGWRHHFEEVSRRRGDYAIAGLAAGLQVGEDRIADARLVLFALSDRPVRASAAERSLIGTAPGDKDAVRRAEAALVYEVEIIPSGEYTAAYKRHLASVLLRRALSAFAGMQR